MKNNIKKDISQVWEDLLYFQHFMPIFSLAQISDYHHLNYRRKIHVVDMD